MYIQDPPFNTLTYNNNNNYPPIILPAIKQRITSLNNRLDYHNYKSHAFNALKLDLFSQRDIITIIIITTITLISPHLIKFTVMIFPSSSSSSSSSQTIKRIPHVLDGDILVHSYLNRSRPPLFPIQKTAARAECK